MSVDPTDRLQQTFFPGFGKKPFGMIIKPVGSVCNLGCDYCYYLEKKNLYPQNRHIMSDQILKEFVRQYIESQSTDTVSFTWQGGEPCLAGLDFYRKALSYQKTYANGKRIENALQTNGTLLDESWCDFLKSHDYLVGISIDGPGALHDHYRKTSSGSPSFDKVHKALLQLMRFEVEFNTLTTINRYNARSPLEIYRYLKSTGSRFMQFIPVVERTSLLEQKTGLCLVSNEFEGKATVTDFSVEPLQFGEFMIAIFNEWVKQDVGKIFVQLFDTTLANRLGETAGVCMYAPICGHAGVIEFNGDIYSCDHFVFPEYLLGNILNTPLTELMNSTRQQVFGQHKFSRLPKSCLKCEVFGFCYGECPKKRFMHTAEGEYGLNYLCEDYKLFFNHAKPYIEFMANEYLNQRAPANVMGWKLS